MGLDDIMAAADREQHHARELAAAHADQQARLEDEFRRILTEWTASVSRRLEAAGVPHQLAEDPVTATVAPPPPVTGLDAAIGWWRGTERFRPRDWLHAEPLDDLDDLDDEADDPDTPPRIEGWPVYACLSPTPAQPLGVPVRPVPIDFGTGPALERLFITGAGNGIVVQYTPGSPASAPTDRGSPLPRFSLSATGRHGSALARVGRQAGSLTRSELFEVSGLATGMPEQAPRDESWEEFRRRQALDRQLDEQRLADQLVHWELGVRHLLAGHGR